MAGPFGFFKGLYARVLYAMPATAICWSTYEFAKFILSQQTRDEYHSTRQLASAVTLPKDILANAADKVRLDEKLGGLSYVLPSTSAGSKEFEDEQQSTTSSNHDSDQQQQQPTTSHRPSSTSSSVPTGSLLSRELPSMSGTGIYSSALSLNTMHTDSGASRQPGMAFDGRCST